MSVLDEMREAATEPTEERYLILERIGRGGMGQVFLAEKLDDAGKPVRPVVLKTILPYGSPEEVARRKQMFRREMEIAAKLEHPNIVRVTDWGTDLFGSDHYFEMERIKGISLAELLVARGTPLDEEGAWGALCAQDVAWVGMQACKGLHYAHTFALTGEDDTQSGVAHRDISPDNLMGDVLGHVKIADWGIAKAVDTNFDASKTHTFAGKLRYMAPEQIRGTIDNRADIYSLGVTLTALLAGKHVFTAPHGADEVYYAHMVMSGKRPTAHELAPDAPPALLDLLECMMQLDRERRPRTAGELVDEFETIAVELGGRLSAVQRAFAATIGEHHKEGKRTKKAIESAHQSVPSKSTRRPISAATQPDSTPETPSATSDARRPEQPSHESSGLQATVQLPNVPPLAQQLAPPAPVAPTTVEPTPTASSSRPKLIAALAISLLALSGLLAGLAGFAASGWSGGSSSDSEAAAVDEPADSEQAPSPAPTTPTTEPSPGPELPTTPVAETEPDDDTTQPQESPSAAAEAPTNAPDERATTSGEPARDDGSPAAQRPHSNRPRPERPRPEIRPLAPDQTPRTDQRATRPTPSLDDLLGN